MRRDIPVVLVAVLGLLPAVGCNRKPPAPAGVAPPVAPQITVVKPERRTVKRVVEQPGVILAFEETSLYAKIPGFVGKIEDDPANPEIIQTVLGGGYRLGLATDG